MRTARPSALTWLVRVTILLFCLPILVRPFGGDQSLYLLMGDRLRNGAVLYRDVWDVKQPGLPFFYALTSALAGGASVGPHLGEIAVLVGMAIGLQRTIPLRSAALRAVSPIIVLGPYLVDSRSSDLTQLEFLVTAPLYFCLWALSSENHGTFDLTRRRVVSAGIAAGMVALFKLAYMPIPLAMMLFTLRRGRVGWSKALSQSMIFGGSILLVWAPFLLYAGHYGLWHDLYQTWFVFPRTMTSLGGHPISRLATSVFSISVVLAPCLVLAGMGLVHRLRHREVNRWVTNCLVWIGFGGVGVLVQNWWRYHFYLFIVPIGLLAVDGLDRCLIERREPDRSATRVRLTVMLTIVGLMIVVPLADGSALWRNLERTDFAVRSVDRSMFQALDDAVRPTIQAELAPRTLRPVDGNVFYFGTPMLQRAAGDRLVTAVHGWSPEFYNSAIWSRLAGELRRAHPAAVYVDSFSRPLLLGRGAEIQQWLDHRYPRRAATPDGTWYFSPT